MSLLGKILALLNIFGAIGVVFLASMDYGKRQSWAYKQFRHELMLNGLPIDDKERSANDIAIVQQIGEEPPRALFQGVNGPPVWTQVQEVERVQGVLAGKLEAAKDKRARTHLLSRILLPLTDAYHEREQLLSCRWWLVDDKKAADFKKRCVEAFREAVKPPPPGEEARPFDEAFTSALRTKGGEPAETFANMLVRALPKDPKKAAGVKFEEVYEKAFDAQLADLDKRYQDLFNGALKGPVPSSYVNAGQAMEMQKHAVARLLFGLCLFLAEDAIETDKSLEKDATLLKGLPREGAAYGMRLADTETYRGLVKRVHVVCGIRAGLDAISERAVVLRKLADEADKLAGRERLVFVADYTALVEQIKKRAALLQHELALKEESNRKLTLQKELVLKRKGDVKQAREELEDLQAKTAEKAKTLRKMSDGLLKVRLENRDLIRLTQESEKTIRDLENRIKELEKTR